MDERSRIQVFVCIHAIVLGACLRHAHVKSLNSYNHMHTTYTRVDAKPPAALSLLQQSDTFLYSPDIVRITLIIPTDYPALPVIQQENIVQSIFVDALTSGAVQVAYRSPDGGRVLVSLYNSANDILLRISMRFDSSFLVLNSKTAEGPWHTEVHPPGFPTYFPCCGSVITVRIEILETAFVIFANGIEISTFEFRIPPPIAEFEYYFNDFGTPEKAELLSMSVHN